MLDCELVIDKTTRNGILIIGNPRSLTTTLERYFIRRGDFHIIHEPVTRHVFSTKTDIVKSPYPREATSGEILAQVTAENTSGRFLIKEMAWAVQDADILDNLPPHIQVILMIRKPEQAVLSHLKLHKVNAELEKQLNADFTSFHGPQQVMDYKIIKSIFDRLNKSTGPKAILLDADDLARAPEVIIPQLCEALGIDFDRAHLQWESGENKFWPYTDGTWQKEITASTGFTPLKNEYSLSALTLAEQSELKPLIEQNEIIYQEMLPYRLQPATHMSQLWNESILPCAPYILVGFALFAAAAYSVRKLCHTQPNRENGIASTFKKERQQLTG